MFLILWFAADSSFTLVCDFYAFFSVKLFSRGTMRVFSSGRHAVAPQVGQVCEEVWEEGRTEGLWPTLAPPCPTLSHPAPLRQSKQRCKVSGISKRLATAYTYTSNQTLSSENLKTFSVVHAFDHDISLSGGGKCKREPLSVVLKESCVLLDYGQ